MTIEKKTADRAAADTACDIAAALPGTGWIAIDSAGGIAAARGVYEVLTDKQKELPTA